MTPPVNNLPDFIRAAVQEPVPEFRKGQDCAFARLGGTASGALDRSSNDLRAAGQTSSGVGGKARVEPEGHGKAGQSRSSCEPHDGSCILRILDLVAPVCSASVSAVLLVAPIRRGSPVSADPKISNLQKGADVSGRSYGYGPDLQAQASRINRFESTSRSPKTYSSIYIFSHTPAISPFLSVDVDRVSTKPSHRTSHFPGDFRPLNALERHTGKIASAGR